MNKKKNEGCGKRGCLWVLKGIAIYYIIALLCLLKPWEWIYYGICDGVDKSHIHGYDYRLFYDTEAWPLAKACRKQDTLKIERIIRETGIDANYKDSLTGRSVFNCAISNEDAASVKTLLRLGADPNIPLWKEYPSGNSFCIETSPKIYKALLPYCKDPNAIVSKHYGHLISLWAGDNDELTELLVEAGAKVNIDSLCDGEVQPIVKCITKQHFKMAFYLLEHGAWYDERINVNGYGILYLLRVDCSLLSYRQHKYKMKVVQFLQEKGLDYWSYPIPEETLKEIKAKHPWDWEDYCKRY